MKTIQKVALEAMSDRNLGAVRIPHFGWVFPEAIRNSEEVAYLVCVELATAR